MVEKPCDQSLILEHYSMRELLILSRYLFRLDRILLDRLLVYSCWENLIFT